MHRERLRKVFDPAGRQQEEDDYVRERRRIAEARDRKIETLGAGG
jgi:hypothetical protein